MTDARPSLDLPHAPVEGDLRLPKPPGVIRQFWYRHPRLTDALIAALYLVPTIAVSIVQIIVNTEHRDRTLLAAGIVVLVGGGAALLWRRSHPWVVLVVAWVVALVGAPVWQNVDLVIVALAVYGLAVYASVRAAWIGFGGSVIVGFGAAALVKVSGQGDIVGNGVQAAVLLLLVVLVSINIGNRRRYVVALLDRAAQLARESDQQAQLAAIAERARIAREMHDIVSHGLTVMVTLAEGSAAMAAADPDRAAAGMRQVAETGRQALGDMRRMLGVLSDGAASTLEPQPGVDQLRSLAEQFRAAGLPVALRVEGEPPTDPAQQLTIYRLVQESLTNALRHGRGTEGARVAVRYTDADVRIAVTNRGPVAAPAAVGGHGLVGMRERVGLYGGSLESGPRATGGWSVVATLPHETAATAPTAPTPEAIL